MELIESFMESLPAVAFIIGLAAVVFGSDFLVDGACAIARRSGLSEFIIGITIVGFGTSCPELVVSLTGSIEGNADVSIGNVIGSNIFNTLLILGLTSLIMPIAITSHNKLRDIPLTFIVTTVFILFGLYGNNLTRIEGILFLLMFAGYMFYSFRATPSGCSDSGNTEGGRAMGAWTAVAAVAGGLFLLIAGGKVFVDSAIVLATRMGVSDKLIAITLLAGGTSFPELATCLVAAFRNKGQLALGNILGSNVFNILLILGTSAVVRPLSLEGMNAMDLIVLALSALSLMAVSATGKKDCLDRAEGAFFVVLWLSYILLLFLW